MKWINIYETHIICTQQNALQNSPYTTDFFFCVNKKG